MPKISGKKIVLLTGARQTGKTTSLSKHYPELKRYNLDSFEIQDYLDTISSFEWREMMNNVFLDEIQKKPSLMDKIKYAYDESLEPFFSVLSGSAQILLLRSIRESLAGRIYIYELMPLTVCELSSNENESIGFPLIHKIITNSSVKNALDTERATIDPVSADRLKKCIQHLFNWGGMPALLPMEDILRRDWMRSYIQSYLERDLSDLARLSDLAPFRKFQEIASHRAGCILSFSDLARDTAISTETARRYMKYLELSYQVLLLRPYYENITSTVIKTPKLYWIDLGICRYTGGDANDRGVLYENFCVSEIYKYITTLDLNADIYFYRTKSGMEIDMLIKTSKGIIGIEIKNREKTTDKDAKNLKYLANALGDRWLGGIVIHPGSKIQEIMQGIYSIPDFRLFS